MMKRLHTSNLRFAAQRRRENKGAFMKTRKKIALVIAALLLTLFAITCESTGQYMPSTGNETIIGTVQANFTVQGSMFTLKSTRDAVDTQSYIKLMEVAGLKYSGNIDIRDIVWVTGDKTPDYLSTMIFATGKVIKVD